MKWYMRRKALLLAALTLGTTFQISACAQASSLFGLQVFFSSFTLPLNQLLVQVFAGIAGLIPTFSIV